MGPDRPRNRRRPRGRRLEPVVCLNKTDLLIDAAETPDGAEEAEPFEFIDDDEAADDVEELPLDVKVHPLEAMAHYAAMGIVTLQTSVTTGDGLDGLREALVGRETVLAGHSGVGKSSLISSIQPGLDLRVAEVSLFNDKGESTRRPAPRRYPLDAGGAVIDTPGVKQVRPVECRAGKPDRLLSRCRRQDRSAVAGGEF